MCFLADVPFSQNACACSMHRALGGCIVCKFLSWPFATDHGAGHGRGTASRATQTSPLRVQLVRRVVAHIP